MKHIHFVIYRLKSINIYCCYFFYFFIYLLTHFFIIFYIYLEIEFIKTSDDVKIRRKTITFTKDKKYRTVFINKIINSGIMKMFILFFTIFIFKYSILSAKFYAFAQMIGMVLVWKIFSFFCKDFIFLLFNNLMRY
jgi:hypothetical protein